MMQRWLLGSALAVVLVLIGVLLAYGLGILPLQSSRPPLEVSPAAATSAEMKLARLSGDGEEVRLTAIELTSLFRYRPESWSLGVVRSPRVEMSGDTIRIGGRVATDELPAHPQIDRLRIFLPDTASIEIAGTVQPLDARITIVQVASVEIAGMPIPSAFFSHALDRLGRDADVDLPPGAVSLPLPPGISSARVENGELVLTP